MLIFCPECQAIGVEGSRQEQGDRLDWHGFALRGHERGRPVFECEKCSAWFFQPFSFPRKRPKESVAIPFEQQLRMRTYFEERKYEANVIVAEAGMAASDARLRARRHEAGTKAGKIACPVCGVYVKPAGLAQHTAAKHPDADGALRSGTEPA